MAEEAQTTTGQEQQPAPESTDDKAIVPEADVKTTPNKKPNPAAADSAVSMDITWR